MRRCALIALLTMVCLAEPAQAGWRINRATAIAQAVWNSPCKGNVTLRWAPLASVHAAEATRESCLIVFDNTTRVTWRAFCMRMLHEYGHLAGYRDPTNASDPLHSANPDSIMSVGAEVARTVVVHRAGGVSEVQWTDPRCRERGRPFLEAHRLL